MLFRKFDPADGKEYVDALRLDDIEEDCLEAIYRGHTNDSGNLTPTLTIPAVGSVLQVDFKEAVVCNGGVSLAGKWRFTPERAGSWDFNISIIGAVPGSWTAAGLVYLWIYKNGVPLHVTTTRNIPQGVAHVYVGDTEFYVHGSAQVWVDGETDVITVCLSQSGAAPQTITNWAGVVDAHYGHRNDCVACTP